MLGLRPRYGKYIFANVISDGFSMFSVRNRQSHRSSLSRLARCGAKEWPMGAPNHITFLFWEFQLSFHDETTDHTQD